jgi:hypothetical protein
MLLSTKHSFCLDLASLVGCLLLSLAGCSRTPIREGESAELDDPYTCVTDADCRGIDACQIRVCSAGLCQTTGKITCNDGNPCTNDVCNPADGSCSYPWVTSDADGDGYFAPLPGKKPTDADACGNDCDDSAPAVHPQAVEACDGIDNDCNGVADDSFRYDGTGEPLSEAVWVSASAVHEALPGALAYDGEAFAMSTTERSDFWQGMFHSVTVDGEIKVDSWPISADAVAGMSGPMVWTGSVFGTAWEDRREKSYEIYFNHLDANGRKLHPDLRVTNSDGFSVQPSLVFDGTGWLLAYADDQNTDVFRIFTQRISSDATLSGSAASVTPPDVDARQPRLSRNADGIGLFYYSYLDTQFYYQRLDASLQTSGNPVAIGVDGPADASIRWNGDRYVLAWTPQTDAVADAVWAMTVDSSGRVISVPRRITSGASMARSPTIVALGNRFVLIWADDHFSSGSYELSMQTFTNDLVAVTGQQQVTKLGSDSIDPVGVIGGGALGILFRSRLYHDWQTFFIALQCWNVPTTG